MVKILNKNGVNNTNIDGASFNNFCAGQRSGIIKGRLNECAITVPSSSVLSVNTGELLIYGVRLIKNTATQFTFSTFPSSAIRYSIVEEIVIDDNSVITERTFIQQGSVALIQDNLYKTETGAGTYQIELARFTLTPNGIEDLIRTVDIITGGMGGDGAHWEVGEITTEKLAPDLNAEVDIDYNEDTKKYDFNFALPEANNIVSVLKTSTTGLVDTYTITFMNGETKTFDVTNGKSIVSILKTATVGNVDTYTITYNDSTTSTFTVSNSPIQTVNGKNDVNVVLKTDDISDTDQINKWSTAEEKEKVSKIIISGDGKKALLNDGTYGEVGTVDTVNNVLPDENKNITITADDIAYDEDNSVKDELDIKVDKEFSSDYAYTEGLVVTWKSDTNTYRVGDGTETNGNGYTGTSTEIIIPKFFDDGVHGIAPIDEIGILAFYIKTSITSITIPDSVTGIRNLAFAYCSGLTSITIPDSVTGIGNLAFAYCSGLTSITIPNSVTSIGTGAFDGCTRLTSITIPNSVTSIGTGAFRGCSSLTEMTVLATTPPTLSNTSAISTATTVIYVPYSSLTAYKTATNWSTYADRIFPIPDGKWIKDSIDTKATTQSYTSTLPSANWTGTSAPYSKEVTVSGILATDEPTFGINFNGVYDDELIARSNLGLVYKYVTSANTITFYSDAIPTADIPLIIKVVR